MEKSFLLFAFIATLQMPPYVFAASRIPHVLITSFVPFFVGKTNMSMAVARELKRMAPEFGAVVDLCESLPVTFQGAAPAAIRCYEAAKIKPTVMISLGEGNCSMQFETRSVNLNNTEIPDNKNRRPKNIRIEPNGPIFVGSLLPLQEAFCQRPQMIHGEEEPISFSTSAGSYVCNDLSYRMTRYFKNKPVAYGFVHVPNGECEKRVYDPHKNAATLFESVHAMLLYLSNSSKSVNLPHPSNRRAIPATLVEADQALGLLEPWAPSCYAEFLQHMQTLYGGNFRK